MSRSSVSPVRQTGHGAYTCLSGYPFFYEGVLLFRHARAARKAWITETPAKAVMPEASLSGRTSTRSMAATSIFLQIFRTMQRACRVEKPSTSGVPVPGAYEASRKSMSKVKKTGLPCSRAMASAIIASQPLLWSSSPRTIRKPLFLG